MLHWTITHTLSASRRQLDSVHALNHQSLELSVLLPRLEGVHEALDPFAPDGSPRVLMPRLGRRLDPRLPGVHLALPSQTGENTLAIQITGRASSQARKCHALLQDFQRPGLLRLEGRFDHNFAAGVPRVSLADDGRDVAAHDVVGEALVRGGARLEGARHEEVGEVFG